MLILIHIEVAYVVEWNNKKAITLKSMEIVSLNPDDAVAFHVQEPRAHGDGKLSITFQPPGYGSLSWTSVRSCLWENVLCHSVMQHDQQFKKLHLVGFILLI